MRPKQFGIWLLAACAFWTAPAPASAYPGSSGYASTALPFRYPEAYTNVYSGPPMHSAAYAVPPAYAPYPPGPAVPGTNGAASCAQPRSGYTPLQAHARWTPSGAAYSASMAEPVPAYPSIGPRNCIEPESSEPGIAALFPATAADMPSPRTVTYAVGPGDTPYSIAKQFGVSPQELMDFNNIYDPTKLRIGQKLKIPAPETAGPDLIPAHRKVVKVLSSTLTAYTAGYESTGKTPSHPQYGITFSGVRAKEGRTVAVDPKIIPLGSTVLIEGIGIRKAEDTGSAIRGSKIDVFIEDLRTARKFGVKKNVKVYVLADHET